VAVDVRLIGINILFKGMGPELWAAFAKMKCYCLHFGQQVRIIQGLTAPNTYFENISLICHRVKK